MKPDTELITVTFTDQIVNDITDEELQRIIKYCGVFIPVKFDHLTRIPYSNLSPIRSLLKIFLSETMLGLNQCKGGGCTLAGPGRGDCENAIGLPGISIPNRHDGKDITVDVYGKPNGWCWSCWKSHQIGQLQKQVTDLKEIIAGEPHH